MHPKHCNTGTTFASALQEQFDAIDAAYARGEFGSSRRDEYISASFFRTLEDYYLGSDRAPAPLNNATQSKRSRRILHYRVMLITGAETMLVKRGRQELELGLCSVRVPVRLQDRVAAALCELLQFERVRIRICCRDTTGLLRGVVEKVDHTPDGKTVNATLIAAGLGHAEASCRKCEISESVPEPMARAGLERWLATVDEQAERRFAYLLQ
ncbi:MAG TPA: hypothetical protein VF618_12255 [Thermoanaerobaculia bacterium]